MFLHRPCHREDCCLSGQLAVQPAAGDLIPVERAPRNPNEPAFSVVFPQVKPEKHETSTGQCVHGGFCLAKGPANLAIAVPPGGVSNGVRQQAKVIDHVAIPNQHTG